MLPALIVIDDEFVNLEGHPYEYNKSVLEAFRDKGHEVVIYSNKALLQNIHDELKGTKKWFSFNSKSPVRKIPILGAIAYRSYFNRAFREQVRALMADVESRFQDYIIFIPSAYWYNILPIAQSFRNTTRPVAFLYRFSIFDAVRVPKMMKPLIFPLIKHAAGVLKKNKRIVHFSDSNVIADEWQHNFHHPMHVLPIPHLAAAGSEVSHSPEGDKIRLYLPGSIRIEKGVDLLTQSMELMAAKYPEYASRLILATQFPLKNEELNTYKQRLSKLPIEMDFLGYLSSDEYNNQFTKSDIVLIPYQAQQGYKSRTSGVLAEAIAAQRPVITTTGTWMASQLAAYKSGLAVDENPQDLVDALIKIINDYDRYYLEMKQAAVAWSDFHSKSTFYKLFMQAIEAGH